MTMQSETITGRRTLTPDEQLILEIKKSYPSPSGSIRWVAAWADHPDWKARLSYGPKDTKQKKAHNILAKLKREGLLDGKHTTNRLAQLAEQEPVRPFGGAGKQKLDPQTVLVLRLMLKHAPQNGRVKLKRLDELEPGWDKDFPNRKKAHDIMSRLRRTGRFQREKKMFEQLQGLVKQASNGHGNGNGHANIAEEPEPITEQELERRISKRADEQLDALLAEVGHCAKCGKSFVEALRRERLSQKIRA